jgi:hypothetical protein
VEDKAAPGVTAAVSHLPYPELDGLRAHHARLPHLVDAHALEAVRWCLPSGWAWWPETTDCEAPIAMMN